MAPAGDGVLSCCRGEPLPQGLRWRGGCSGPRGRRGAPRRPLRGGRASLVRAPHRSAGYPLGRSAAVPTGLFYAAGRAGWFRAEHPQDCFEKPTPALSRVLSAVTKVHPLSRAVRLPQLPTVGAQPAAWSSPGQWQPPAWSPERRKSRDTQEGLDASVTFAASDSVRVPPPPSAMPPPVTPSGAAAVEARPWAGQRHGSGMADNDKGSEADGRISCGRQPGRSAPVVAGHKT